MEGWIKLHRRLIKHWIWKNDKYLKAWIYCLFRANHDSTKILIGSSLVELMPGEFITSRGNFANDTGMTERGVRTFLELLETDKMIVRKTTSKMTMITICNYELYQDKRPANDQPVTNKRPASDQQTTTDKNVKKEKELKEFKEEVYTFKEKYNPEMLEDFIRYWIEPNKSKTKMKFQLQQTWDLAGRLVTWNNRSYKKPESKNLYPGYTDSSFD